jgi:hypothetical protein
MRLPYMPKDPVPKDLNEEAILYRVVKRRGAGGLLPLDLTLLHSFPVADGWNAFLGAIRSDTILSSTLREMLICRVAVLNKADFEWDHHVPILVRDGFPSEHLDVLKIENLKHELGLHINNLWKSLQGSSLSGSKNRASPEYGALVIP